MYIYICMYCDLTTWRANHHPGFHFASCISPDPARLGNNSSCHRVGISVAQGARWLGGWASLLWSHSWLHLQSDRVWWNQTSEAARTAVIGFGALVQPVTCAKPWENSRGQSAGECLLFRTVLVCIRRFKEFGFTFLRSSYQLPIDIGSGATQFG